MGAYATCWVGNLEVTSSKNQVDPGVMNLFRAADRRVRRYGDPDLPPYLAEQWEHPEDGIQFTYYEAPVSAVRDRLELVGYTFANCRRLFEEWKALEIQRREEYQADRRAEDHSGDTPDRRKMHEEFDKSRDEDLARLRAETVDQWIAHIRRIVEEGLTRKDADGLEDSYLGDMLKSHDDKWYGYGGPDPLVAIRLAIEALPAAEHFIYDLTDLVVQEYLTEDEDPIERLIDWSAGDYHTHGRAIILTEGRSDVAILKPALDLLFPHLAGYFSFMDFAEYGGGAGQLANLIRGFAAAGVVNRVIALFDNDAAALAAMRALGKSPLPKHVVAMRLPDLQALNAYPTLGPTGLSNMNINGLAASIELYLGMDVLRGDSGELPPVQWTGYERSVAKYQGELVGKQEVQTRFLMKLNRARQERSFFESADWSGLRAIFSEVFKSFHSLDGEMLSAQLKYFYREN